MQTFFQVLSSRREQIVDLALQHIQLTLIAIVIAVIIGVPLGIFITRNKKMANIVIGIANLVQAIPSMALLGFLIPFVGIGSTPAIIMVVLYSMLPIIKNTYAGLMNISPDMLEVAKGIGLTKRQTLRLVKIPLAVPIIMTGVRISAVTAVGLMTIAAFVGAGGLGFLVFSGIESVDTNLILLGAIPAALLALVIDFVVGRIENMVVPNGIKTANGKMKRRKNRLSSPVKKKITAAVTIIAIVLLVYGAFQSMVRKDTITIASKSFTEQLILGNILAELIENRTDIEVERKLNLGGTQIIFTAMQNDEVDLYIEYSGTAYSSILNHAIEGANDAGKVFETVRRDLQERYGIKAFDPIGFNNTYAIVVTQETADKWNLETISDLAIISNQFVFGPTIEFVNREDGLIGMEEVYQVNFSNIKPMRGALRYTALVNGEVDAISGFTTDGLIERHNLVVLEDNKEFFLPYYAFTLIREEVLAKHPELEELLDELTGLITDDMMRYLNYQVDVEGMAPEVVAHEFLVSKNLIFE